MQTVNLYDAKNQFSKLVDAVEGGEVVVIARNGKPAAKLVPLSYGERTEWSGDVQRFMQGGEYDPEAFEVDRNDVLPAPERDLF
ncbi:type II toxin-antitoxin system prevent-host-death family antitoxin [Deinococcus metallilatus]|uniref:Antitoxin n=1 Tax=Deinococcus metallilatus TaxID=1211322 RepID=A0AAJ5F1E2_9DEIO|nr:type II toxin-antitoxin system prevent-host-death family antitoxin [Deinococcus metallilatus]MBB5296216.1 prevent-host-death family protein [Deinococcus metallilatus]QBY09737.1 type II toxin-antitoxin system prevent-host-death family antitoxin [Deinococcus metallilatus]RXJ08935.1 type II toxin-antitoxin system prevent-host-death family antitoxin [Deinococcus metallilatus]TLK23686.1 type II toxin-antitoxin system prevent-host-death family antitoxin [Deinococcus metallilatus]GMA14082.1 hypoth